jgi:antitoxin VapB
MALYLKDPEVDKAARELARIEGTSITEAVGNAIRERRERLRHELAERERRVREILAEIDKLPVLDPRSPDEMLYDEDGLPK